MNKRLRSRQFYALAWKDLVVRRRHIVWTLLELTIPVLACALAILSSLDSGSPKLEPERTYDADNGEKIFMELDKQRHTLLVAPNSSFTRALLKRIDADFVKLELVDDERHLEAMLAREVPASLDAVIRRILPDEAKNMTIGGVTVASSSLLAPQQQQEASDDDVIANMPRVLSLTIRATNFRLQSAPFPKKTSLAPFNHGDHYVSSYFMAAQLLLSRAYLSLMAEHWNTSLPVPALDDLVGQRMPYPQHVVHKRLRDSTLSNFVAGAQKQKLFIVSLDSCVAYGFLIGAIFLAKRLVDERKSRVKDMLQLVGVPNSLYFGSHLFNTTNLMLLQCALIAFIFAGHEHAPQKNVDATLLYATLAVYSLAACSYVILLSTQFASSTRAIICTALVWLGAPEVLDRVFMLDAGVIESSGFVSVDERLYALLGVLSPNFALRIATRLLTESDIYGEFYNKKKVYAEYTATWANINTPMPLYNHLTLAKVLATLALSTLVYVLLLVTSQRQRRSSPSSCSSQQQQQQQPQPQPQQASNFSTLGAAKDQKRTESLPVAIVNLLWAIVVTPIVAPFSLVAKLISAFTGNKSSSQVAKLRSTTNSNSSAHDSLWRQSVAAQHLTAAYDNDGFVAQQQAPKPAPNFELNHFEHQDAAGKQTNDCQTNLRLAEQLFEVAPRTLQVGVSVQRVCRTYVTNSKTLKTIDAVQDVSLDLYYSQILGKLISFAVWPHALRVVSMLLTSFALVAKLIT